MRDFWEVRVQGSPGAVVMGREGRGAQARTGSSAPGVSSPGDRDGPWGPGCPLRGPPTLGSPGRAQVNGSEAGRGLGEGALVTAVAGCGVWGSLPASGVAGLGVPGDGDLLPARAARAGMHDRGVRLRVRPWDGVRGLWWYHFSVI